MPAESLTTVQEAPEPLDQDHLQESLDLIRDEATETVRHGRGSVPTPGPRDGKADE
jgi:hypothetical protein